MVIQKDWIAYDLGRGDIFRLSIACYTGSTRRGRKGRKNDWFIIGFVNYHSLPTNNFSEVLGQEYARMFEAMKNSEQYHYSISPHNFSWDELEENISYWQGLLRRKPQQIRNVSLPDLHYPVNRGKLGQEIYRLVPDVDHSGAK